MKIIVIIAFVILCLLACVLQNRGREGKIDEKIKSIGGEVINIERRNIFTGIGPFMVVGKGRSVYRIKYRIGNETNDGWVRFGDCLGRIGDYKIQLIVQLFMAKNSQIKRCELFCCTENKDITKLAIIRNS